ncbi:hypothetical protein [Kribbella sp. VKM Ac-2566]|uniref:hypothetical protein n=1 Tax=Kribbella sp. VKM Ac-2566 TaxID=2512218 RepID=UPI001062EF56|nr:hypothetical protein [Kribbella sp. VKM Ac-2566]TDX03521.1 hypothetical protein EV647_1760 [Kribbella sp. VKM Ac-2566]
MNTQLTDLMHRATENLEPVTPDLLERSVAQGLRLRRRRTAIATASGAGAVLATAGLIAGGIQLAGSPTNAAVAGSPVPTAKPSAKPSAKVTPTAKPAGVNLKQTLATLKGLVAAPGRTFSNPETWGEGDFAGAAYVVNDGHGAARVDVLLSGGGEQNPCVPKRAGCSTLPDGSVLYVSKESPVYSDSRQAEYGVVSNYVVLFRRDGRNINLTSYNGPAEKGKQHTRPKPLLSVEDLSALAKSKAWKLPPVSPSKGMK